MTLTSAASLVVSVYGLVAGALAFASTRTLGTSLAVGVELLMAAGLLKLSADRSWEALAGAAAVVLVRKVVVSAFAAPCEPERRA